ncbi:MAG: hypothetical protein ACREK5_11395 [Gemmatimonadota bacterium]
MRIPIRTVVLALVAIGVAPVPARPQESALQSAIRSFGPEMSLPEEKTLVVREDFNGDGRQDVAAVVRGPDRSALVVFHGTPQGYEMHPLYTRLPKGDVQLRVVPSGRQPVVGNAGGVQLAHPAIELIFPGRSSAMYAWEKGRYQVYGTESFYAR